GLNAHLAANGVTPVETDLGEYIIQLRGERPSHIIAPAMHLNKGQIADTFRDAHKELDANRPLDDAQALLAEAREVMRGQYFAAQVGITGANFLIAETGSSVIVTNEGNGDLSQLLPRVHIVVASIEKVVPTLEDAQTLIRLLARSATGQEMSAYTTISTGPRRPDDLDGPDEYHVVLLDNGRSRMLGTEFQEMLRCIKCGACMNHCPVYRAVGGHAYGWVYAGPMGSVLTPLLLGLEEGGVLATASTFCGACEAVCPVKIPLPGLLRRLRELRYEQGGETAWARWAIALWAWFAARPWAYRAKANAIVRVMHMAAGKRGRLRRWPLLGAWTKTRDLPAPGHRTFVSQWHDAQRKAQKR
ncbi:MAG: LUD domain-containing protein, partial [Alphaproteobacteria bacterium]|nr:LUD domain-containing protein [Alphaproteobacteria bacterium]